MHWVLMPNTECEKELSWEIDPKIICKIWVYFTKQCSVHDFNMHNYAIICVICGIAQVLRNYIHLAPLTLPEISGHKLPCIPNTKCMGQGGIWKILMPLLWHEREGASSASRIHFLWYHQSPWYICRSGILRTRLHSKMALSDTSSVKNCVSNHITSKLKGRCVLIIQVSNNYWLMYHCTLLSMNAIIWGHAQSRELRQDALPIHCELR